MPIRVALGRPEKAVRVSAPRWRTVEPDEGLIQLLDHLAAAIGRVPMPWMTSGFADDVRNYRHARV